MEEAKFYTPDIFEFHPGFRYEKYIPGSGNEYSKMEFNLFESEFVANCYRRKLEEAWLRVKCLDREDIESLGWRYHEPIPPDNKRLFFVLEVKDKRGGYVEYSICYNYISKWMLISASSANMRLVERFSGYIKNVSELRKLMKQLNIKP